MAEHVIEHGRLSAQNKAVLKNLLAGGVAGAVSRTVVSPLERMKILFQVQGPSATKFIGIVPTLRRIWREEGLSGFMKGNGTNVIRIVPYSAIQFACYEGIKKFILKPSQNELETAEKLTAGALAGIISVTCVYPLDLVRTRLSLSHRLETRIVPCMLRIFRDEGGFLALYCGLVPTLLGVAPYVALNFTVYETLRSYVSRRSKTEPSIYLKLTCGGLAGAAAQTVTYPLDVLRRRMQVVAVPELGFKYSGLLDACRTIMHEEGVRGFYKGMVPNYLKVVPAISVSFVTFEYVKAIMF